MIDREKVIKGLEQFRADLKPFCGNHADWERFDSALAMLKEQEAVKPMKLIEENEWTVCGCCKNHIISKWSFCPYCGKAVKWE